MKQYGCHLDFFGHAYCSLFKTKEAVMKKSKISHLSFEVANFKKSLAFYLPIMKLLKFKASIEDNWAYFTAPDGFIFNISQAEKAADRTKNVHLAFHANTSKKIVDQFYELGLATGGKSNGKPGIRKNYAPDYYAAFVFDPDGHNLEVVSRHSSK
jgi:predicted lactoylglutathione lyase